GLGMPNISDLTAMLTAPSSSSSSPPSSSAPSSSPHWTFVSYDNKDYVQMGNWYHWIPNNSILGFYGGSPSDVSPVSDTSTFLHHIGSATIAPFQTGTLVWDEASDQTYVVQNGDLKSAGASLLNELKKDGFRVDCVSNLNPGWAVGGTITQNNVNQVYSGTYVTYNNKNYLDICNTWYPAVSFNPQAENCQNVTFSFANPPAIGSSTVNSGAVALANGELIKTSSSSAIYENINYCLYHIGSYTAYNNLGGNMRNVLVVPKLPSMPYGGDIW
ncbi:MAG: hypothetical protein OWS74_09435, partial [Firmicutes bacterium]|nr:hypothetical protein [Bacillota bacterium]